MSESSNETPAPKQTEPPKPKVEPSDPKPTPGIHSPDFPKITHSEDPLPYWDPRPAIKNE